MDTGINITKWRIRNNPTEAQTDMRIMQAKMQNIQPYKKQLGKNKKINKL